MSLSMDIERRLSVPLSEVVDLVRKAYGKPPAECSVHVAGTSYPADAQVTLCWVVNEQVAKKAAE